MIMQLRCEAPENKLSGLGLHFDRNVHPFTLTRTPLQIGINDVSHINKSLCNCKDTEKRRVK